jgi:two-component system sensor histidine kinase ResE
VIRPLRRSFAAKLVVGGCVLALVVVGGVASYLIFSRTTQTRAAAQSNAENRVGVMAQVLDRFTGAEAINAASSVAGQAALRAALEAPDPSAAVTSLLRGTASVDVAGEVLLITDAGGAVLFTEQSPSLGGITPISTAPEAVLLALRGGVCQRSDGGPIPGGCGTEIVAGGQPAYVVALPVTDAGGHAIGAVAYAAPLTYQLHRFQALFGFPTAFVAARQTDQEFRPDVAGTAVTDPALRDALGQRSASITSGVAQVHDAVYTAPLSGGGTGSVAGSFVPVRGAAGELTGFMGVEVPIAQFAGDERTDVIVLGLIAVFVLLLVALAVVLFVHRFVKRPVARLERGVARIAGGDYTTDIPVQSDDELGRLAANVNRMRESIAGYVREIEAAREHLDTAVERVRGVSRALTTTTNGVGALHQAVVRAAADIAGPRSASVLAVREADTLVVAASAGDAPALTSWTGVASVLAGETVRLDSAANGVLVAVPMFYQDSVVGALGVVTPTQAAAPDGDVDVDVLAVLANNAAIAMENARLFEQEHQTVLRLRELDSMKTDFLATVQHELRTPLTAILGLSDLLDMCWGMWDDGPKLEAVRDIQVAATTLHDIVETIIDYAAMDDSELNLNTSAVPLRQAITAVLELVGERYKGGLPIAVEVEGGDDVAVLADPVRLNQVLRAVVDNAVKFSDGRGSARVSFAPLEEGRSVRIEVTDQGAGIPAEDLPRIFERFYQVDNTATRKYGGTGMGLALVKRMVDAHRASVEVTSTVGEGTSVVMVWPAPPAAVADDPVPGGADPAPMATPTSDAPSRPSPRPAVPVQ